MNGGSVVGQAIIAVDPSRCLGCRQCLRFCPRNALVVRNDLAQLADASWCDGCGRCLGHCCADALSLTPCP